MFFGPCLCFLRSSWVPTLAPMTGASLVICGCGPTRAPGHPWLPPPGPCLHPTLELQYPSYLPGQTPSSHCHADLTATCPPSSTLQFLCFCFLPLWAWPHPLSVIPAAFQAPNHWSLSSSWRDSFLSALPRHVEDQRLVCSASCLQPLSLQAKVTA